ncbi:MAG: KpsF/GutQ family sugar-phosphate isomerase [Acidobacteriota bacterium]
MTLSGAKRVLTLEAEALIRLRDSLDDTFSKVVERVLSCPGRVVVTGMGKSGLVARKISSTLASTGTPSFFLHPAEALHGDLGMVKGSDLVLALSNSGETEELIRLAPYVKRIGAALVAVTESPRSTLARAADLHLTVAVDQEACPLGLAPMASTTAQLALGDALAAALIERRGFKPEDFARLHPGGKLGKRLMRVRELMHTGAEVPRVAPDSAVKDAIYEISSKKLGATLVTDGRGRLVGILTDGDVRRLIEKHGGAFLSMTAGECATANPLTISPDAMAVEALGIMESRKITSIVVADDAGRVAGLLHLHDLWGLQLI